MTPQSAHDRTSPQGDALQTIAHELRQPLDAMESIAYYLALVLPPMERRAHDQVSRLQQLIEQANWMLTSGLQLADETPLAPEPADLTLLITQAAARIGSHATPAFRLELAANLPLILLDPVRGKVWMENLLTLFQQWSSTRHVASVTTSQNGGWVRLVIATMAPGHRSESTLGPGCGLSLASARRVVAAHHGTFELKISPTSGIVLNIELPSVTNTRVLP